MRWLNLRSIWNIRYPYDQDVPHTFPLQPLQHLVPIRTDVTAFFLLVNLYS